MKIGTIGTSMITGEFLKGIQMADGVECAAVHSREKKRGELFAKKYGVRKVYTELEELYADKTIDLIYIASPNSLHYQQAKRALEHGKHVVCEKPFTVYSEEAEELIRMAKERNLFLIEGITTMYMPNYRVVKEQLPTIGKVKIILCTFCQYSSRYDQFRDGENPNIFNLEFAGGALMDINLYNIYFVVGLYGKPERVHYFPQKAENGIDTSGILILEYPEFLCQCTGAKDVWCENSVQLLGEKGYILVPAESNRCDEVTVVTKSDRKTYNLHTMGHWCIEVQEIMKMIQNQDFEDCNRRLETTLQVVETLEMARKSAGMCF